MPEPLIMAVGSELASDDVTVAVLTNEGYQVEIANSASEARRMLDAGNVDLCILDLTSRSVDGYLVYKVLRGDLKIRPAVLLLMEKDAQYEEGEVAFAGRSRLLEKPFFADQLIVAVRDLLDEGAVGADHDLGHSNNGHDHDERLASKGRVVAIFGTKGGVGKTFVAVNLAAALAKLVMSKVAIVDGDLQFGELAARLRLPADRNLYNIASLGSTINWPAVRTVLRSHRSGLDVVLSPPQPWLGEHISSDLLSGLLAVLRDHYPYVVVDTHTSYDQKTLAALEQADDILLVFTQDPTARRNALAFLAVAKRLGYLTKVWAVLNMFDAQQSPTLQKLEKELRNRLITTIASDPACAVARERSGDPIIGSEGVCWASRDLALLAELLSRLEPARRVSRSRVHLRQSLSIP